MDTNDAINRMLGKNPNLNLSGNQKKTYEFEYEFYDAYGGTHRYYATVVDTTLESATNRLEKRAYSRHKNSVTTKLLEVKPAGKNERPGVKLHIG